MGLGGRYPRLCLAAGLCQGTADGRRAASSFQLFWSSCDGLSCSGLYWAGAGPEIQSLMGTHSLGLRMGCPVLSCKLGDTTPAALLADGLMFMESWNVPIFLICSWLPNLSRSQEEAVTLFYLWTWLAWKVTQLQNIIWNGNVPRVCSRTVDMSEQALPTAPLMAIHIETPTRSVRRSGEQSIITVWTLEHGLKWRDTTGL